MAGRKTRGGIGPGALRMGGAGIRPRAPATPMAGAAMGGAGGPGAGPLGLKKGGHVKKESKSVEAKEEMREKKERRHEKLAKGGIVGGADAKARAGRHAGKAS